jgi:hypothetical protein
MRRTASWSKGAGNAKQDHTLVGKVIRRGAFCEVAKTREMSANKRSNRCQPLQASGKKSDGLVRTFPSKGIFIVRFNAHSRGKGHIGHLVSNLLGFGPFGLENRLSRSRHGGNQRAPKKKTRHLCHDVETIALCRLEYTSGGFRRKCRLDSGYHFSDVKREPSFIPCSLATLKY